MSDYVIEENKGEYGAKIKVVGVGGGGGNMINHIVREKINEQSGMKNVELLAANTDIQALNSSLADNKIILGAKKTKGCGAGMKPEVGRESAEESYDDIKARLETSDIVFIASGFGGGTGTGAAPVVARAAKEMGALTVAVVSTPFEFEGKKRMKLALEGIVELKKECDSIVIIPNEKLLGIIDRKLGSRDSFKLVDEILARAVSGMSSIILDSGSSDINLDFADVKTAMEHRGLSLMGVGAASGDGAAKEALQNAVQSPLLENMDIKGAMGVLVNFRFNPKYPFSEISDAMRVINESADEDADVFFGTLSDETIEEDKVEVTVIATGFAGKNEPKQSEEIIEKIAPVKKERDIFGSYRRVSGGLDINYGEQDLDTPSFLRHRQD